MGIDLNDLIPLRVPPELDRRLERLAKAAGVSKPDYVLDMLAEHLGDREDLEIAGQRVERLRSGESDTISLENVMGRYGMAD